MLWIAEKCCYIAFDTEYPGVLQPTAGCSSSAETYKALRMNVDAMKPIQLGLAFADANHNVLGCWQFNFHFNSGVDRFSAGSIGFLAAAGFDFQRHAVEGLAMNTFGERFTSSGLALSDKIAWVSFHGMYDFAYLLKLLTSDAMPPTLNGFDSALNMFFPRRFDIKQRLPRGSLSRLAEDYGLRRHGVAHQGGSDALLTLDLFFKMDWSTDSPAEFDANGRLFGLHDFLGAAHTNTEETSARRRILAAQKKAAAQKTEKPLDVAAIVVRAQQEARQQNQQNKPRAVEAAPPGQFSTNAWAGNSHGGHGGGWHSNWREDWREDYSSYAPAPWHSTLNPGAPAFLPACAVWV